MSDKPERIWLSEDYLGDPIVYETNVGSSDCTEYIRADLYEAEQLEVESLQRTAEDRGVELERQKQKNRTLLKLMKEDGRDGNLEVEVVHLRKDNTEWQRKHRALRQMYKQERRGKREAERENADLRAVEALQAKTEPAEYERTHIRRECTPCGECVDGKAPMVNCAECGVGGSVDEDGCCVTCGRDALRYADCPACDGGKKRCGECHKCAEERWRQVALNEREVERKHNAAQLAAKDADLRAVEALQAKLDKAREGLEKIRYNPYDVQEAQRMARAALKEIE